MDATCMNEIFAMQIKYKDQYIYDQTYWLMMSMVKYEKLLEDTCKTKWEMCLSTQKYPL